MSTFRRVWVFCWERMEIGEDIVWIPGPFQSRKSRQFVRPVDLLERFITECVGNGNLQIRISRSSNEIITKLRPKCLHDVLSFAASVSLYEEW